MDDKYIKIRKDFLWKGLVILIILLLAGLLVFQICTRINDKKEADYTPVEYVDVTYDHLSSTLTDKSACFICGNPEMSLMPYYRKYDSIGIISFNDNYVVDMEMEVYDDLKVDGEENMSTSIRSTSLDSIKYTVTSNPSRGMADIEITLKDTPHLDTKNLEKTLCSDCLPRVVEVLEHSYKKGEDKEETIPLCLIDFDTLEVYSMQGLYTGYFVRDYWVELEYTEDTIKVSAYYLPVRE